MYALVCNYPRLRRLDPHRARKTSTPLPHPPSAHRRAHAHAHAHFMPLPCFAAAGDPSPAPSSSSTSVYWTHLGAITLTWSRATLGLVLAAELSLAGDGARFVLRPWLPWRRRGSRRFSACGHAVAFSWDLSRARMAARRPEPLSRYFLLVSIDGELALATGDLASSPASTGLLLSRRENAVVSAGRGDAYTTSVAVSGEEHEVSLAVEGAAMWIAVDGEKALQVRRLRWKFRGSESLGLPGGCVRVTWDLHGWLFAPDAAAVFVLRFEEIDPRDANPMGLEEDAGTHALEKQSSSMNHREDGGDEGWCSSDSERRGCRRGHFRSGSKSSPTVSVASTSATSSDRSVATVTEWATPENAALQDGGGGFSLVIYLWKKRRGGNAIAS